MKKFFPLIILLLCSNAWAATYYASSGGGAAASCVDNGANICTLQRAVTVAAGGTNTIVCTAGTYAITTALDFNATNTGANLTIQPASGTVTLGSTGATAVVSIAATMVSGTITFDDIDINETDTDYGIQNSAPEVNVVYKNSSCTNTDATVGACIYGPIDTTNRIRLSSGDDSWTNIKTGATTNVKIAQKIVVGGSNITVNIGSFKLQRKCGNLSNNCDQFVSGQSWDYRNSDTLTMTIETDTAGAPSGTPVTNGTADTKLAFNVPYDSDEWESFTFASNVSLTASTTYWLVLTGSYTASTTNYITAATDVSNGYASGDCATYNGTTWTGCTAGTDLLFTIDRNHTRDFTIQDSILSTRSSPVNVGWSDNFTAQRNTVTSTAGGGFGLSTNNFETTAGNQFNKILIEDNVFSVTTSASNAVTLATSGATFTATYIKSFVFKGNTGETSILTQPAGFVGSFYIVDNDMDLTYTGNTPLRVGVEVDGTDPQTIIDNPFKQIVIENNRFNYPSSTHNHLMLFAMGANNGVFRNNTLTAYNSGGGGNAWGVVVKGNNWTLDHNSVYGTAPAFTIYGTNYTVVTNNTLECFGSGADGCMLVRTHQDQVYGGTHGLPLYLYIKDNIVKSDVSGFVAFEYGTTTNHGVGRTSEYYSDIIDNNIYYAPLATNTSKFDNPSFSENVTSAEGIAVQQLTWQSSNFTASESLSYWNDANSTFGDPGLIDPANGNFKATSGAAKNQGSVPNTNIGSVQSGGSRKWVGRGVN